MPCDKSSAVTWAGAVIAHARPTTDTLAVLFPNTASLKQRSSLVLSGKYRVGGSAYKLATFTSKEIRVC
jgi:hypothetical protein